MSDEPPQRTALPERPANRGVSSHIVVLAACLSILLASRLLDPVDGNLRLGGVTLPTVCVLRQATGIPCPGCGLTRSLVAAVHGDWTESLRHHRAGLILLLVLVAQSVYRVAWLGFPRHRARLTRAGRWVDMSLPVLMALLFVNWIPTFLPVVGLQSY